VSEQPPNRLSTAGQAGFTNWWHGLRDAVHPPPPPPPPPGTPPPPPPPPPTPASRLHDAAQATRRVQTVVASVAGAMGTIQNALNDGFAELTSPIAALFPSLPAATQTMPYLGVPHTHTHPPSLIPPAPPIPLPSIGTIMFGCHVRTTINGLPAARAGDLGLAPTCGGLAPYFEIVTGSSNVFIGGVRAARIGDFCKVCITPDPEPTAIPVGKFMAAVGTAARGVSRVMGVAGQVTQVLGFAADALEIADEAVHDEAAMAAAKALSVAMQVAELVANKVRDAIAQMMGKDPGMPTLGNVLLGHPNVLIGGFPMINFPNPAEVLLGKLSRMRGKAHGGEGKPGVGASGPC
jgi:uncharacterized Zn-binding protein involved in type VI secretion